MDAGLHILSKGQEYRRAWPVLIVSAAGSGVGLAPIGAYSLGALVAPLSGAFGWRRGDIGAAALFQSLGTLAAGALAGGIADRFGARSVALISQIALFLALAAMTLINKNLVSLDIGYFLLAILGAGTLPMVWGRTIVGWFVKSRGFALGLSLVGTGISGALLPTYVSGLVGAFGWRAAYLGLAVLLLFIGLPIAFFFFREPPKRAEASGPISHAGTADQEHTFLEAIRTRCFWQISIALVIVAVAVSGVLVHALPLLTDRGMNRATSAALAGLFGVAVTVGRLVSGYFLDLFRHPAVGSVMFAIAAAACGLLIVSRVTIGLCGAFIFCIGLSAGAESDIAAYLVAKYFGRLNYGAVYGLLYTLFGSRYCRRRHR